MSGVMGVLSYGIGTILGLILVGLMLFWFVQDVTQKKHTVLRNYPVIGRLRYFFEKQGEYFRQYFFAGDRDEMPFNRASRGWVYRLAKNEGGIIGFGSTNDLREPGSIIFVNAPFPVLEEDRLPTPPLLIGEGYCEHPFEARSIVNVSGMSFGAISEPAVRSLSRGACVVTRLRWGFSRICGARARRRTRSGDATRSRSHCTPFMCARWDAYAVRFP